MLRQYLTKQSTLHSEVKPKEYSTTSQARRTAVLRVQQELEEWQQEYRKYSQQLASYTDAMAPFIDKDVIPCL